MKLRPAAAVVDGSDDDDSPPGTFFALVMMTKPLFDALFPSQTAERRAPWRPPRSVSGHRVRATDREPHIETRSRFVSRDARVQAVHSRKSVRAFASENC